MNSAPIRRPLLVVCALFWTSCSHSTSRRPLLKINAVKTGTVSQRDEVQLARAAGRIEAADLQVIASPMTGQIGEVTVKPGMLVNKGEVIARISNLEMPNQLTSVRQQIRSASDDIASLESALQADRSSRRNDLDNIEAQLRDARLKHSRDEVLRNEGLILDLEFKISTFAVADLERRLETTKQELSQRAQSVESQISAKREALVGLQSEAAELEREISAMDVRSPVGGTIETVYVQLGQSVAKGTQLVTVAKGSSLVFALLAIDSRADLIKPGQTATVVVSGTPERGTVLRAAPAVNGGTRSVYVAPESPISPEVLADQHVDGEIDVKVWRNVLSLKWPWGAAENSHGLVFVIAKDRRSASRREVDFGSAVGERIIIRDGLAPGDVVIISDMSALTAYDRVDLE